MKRPSRCWSVVLMCLALLCSGAARAHGPAPAPPVPRSAAPSIDSAQRSAAPSIDEWIGGAMAAWQVSGLAVAAVKDGQVVLCKGYGLRDVKRGLPVTPRTLFALGSITKSFTVLVLATLVAQGKLAWDQPLRASVPDLVLWDPIATEQATARDLVSHRTGLPAHDSVWMGHQVLRRADLVRRLRYLEADRPLRAGFAYNNLIFSLAGYVAEQVAGRPWTELVRERILAPLEMTGARLILGQMQQAPDFARPYSRTKKGVVEMPLVTRDPGEGGPAGSIAASAEDLSRYLLFLLGDRPGRVLPLSELLELRRPLIPVPGERPFAEVGAQSYAMGWYVTSYRGRQMVWHSGSIAGFNAMLALLPDEHIGVVVLGNLAGARLPNPVAWTLLDRLLGVPPAPWSERLLEERQKSAAAEELSRGRPTELRRTGTRPAHELAEYVGTYVHPAYGTLQVEVDGRGGLRLRSPRSVTPLSHFHYDSFTVGGDGPQGGAPGPGGAPATAADGLRLRFQTDDLGEVAALSLPLEPAVPEIRFSRLQADPAGARSARDGRLCGAYLLGDQRWQVLRRGEALLLRSPLGTEHELQHRRGAVYEVAGLSGHYAEFLGDAAAPRELLLHRPDDSALLTRVADPTARGAPRSTDRLQSSP